MKVWALVKAWLKAPMFTPAGFVVRAGMLAGIYGAVSLLGFRTYMCMLSLTFPEGAPVAWSLFCGTVYLLCYFLWLLGVPILLIAAALFAVVRRLLPARTESQP